MDNESLKQLLKDVKKGKITIDKAVGQFKGMPFDDIGFAKIDSHRHIRCGFPEAIFCEGKTTKQIVEIAGQMVKGKNNLIATRANDEIYKAVKKKFTDAKYNKLARIITIKRNNRCKKKDGLISIVSAGTSDIPVAEEARETAEIMGNKVRVLYDVGVAGIHRLLSNREELTEARVIIVVAGMEGALASVVGGLVDCPVVAVPTSIGYGASFGGIAALLSMLNSCSASVSVVNIDNGFGAGCVASLINRK
ncbi:MAG: nickel pincer cofactor biosynthesis protein LarB [Candidatus Anammoxibacter sp.]